MKSQRLIPETPNEVYALWKVGHLRPSDINAIALNWLSCGLGSTMVACLASQNIESFRESETLFLEALTELGVNNINTSTDVKTTIKFYLSGISQDRLDEFMGVERILDVERSFPEIKLFERPDCDLHFAKQRKISTNVGTKFAGQFLGIEKLIGLYYAVDGFDDWTAEQDRECRSKICKESTRLLEAFYA